MASGDRCGCRALSKLEEERRRHKDTIDENLRYVHKIEELHEELKALHNTIADIEKRYSELSARHRKALLSLDEFKILRETYEDVKRELEEERMKRLTTETTLTRDLEEADRSCHAHLRRAASIHELDSQHLKRDISRLQAALEKEQFRHNLTKQRLHHARIHHICQADNYCHYHNVDDYFPCYFLP